MTYEEAYLYMKEAGKRGSIYGTETVKELLLRLGNPQDRVPEQTEKVLYSHLSSIFWRMQGMLSDAIYPQRSLHIWNDFR